MLDRLLQLDFPKDCFNALLPLLANSDVHESVATIQPPVSPAAPLSHPQGPPQESQRDPGRDPNLPALRIYVLRAGLQRKPNSLVPVRALGCSLRVHVWDTVRVERAVGHNQP